MRRIARYTFIVLTLLSLLLCVATSILWLQSFFGGIEAKHCTRLQIDREDAYRFRWFTSIRGGIRLEAADGIAVLQAGGGMYPDDSDWQPYLRFTCPQRDYRLPGSLFGPSTPPSFAERLGFGLTRTRGTDWLGEQWRVGLTLPYWAILLLSLPFPAAFIARRLGRHRSAVGRCKSCGYDLRATPGRCPECGTALPTKVPT